MKILILFYSAYGHVYRMAQAVTEGVKEVKGAEPVLMRVPEILPADILEKTGIAAAQKTMASVPVATLDDLGRADAVIFGAPTRYCNMCGQMRVFLDGTAEFWQKGTFVGKVGSVFTSTATQHGGQESTILSFHTTLLHLGFIIVGLPYAFQEQMRIDEITGCSPYGASTIAGGKGERQPSGNELAGARFQGRHVAQIAARLARQ
jgi:NAD(P)H dehydrogenase (quinone)